jgi:hypothetical protein
LPRRLRPTQLAGDLLNYLSADERRMLTYG